MPTKITSKDDLYVLSHCTKYLARDNKDERHNFNQFTPGDQRARIAESWRFPIVDGYGGAANQEESYKLATVTFVYYRLDAPAPKQVSVVGSFGDLYAPVGLRRVADTDYFTVSVVVPKGEVHYYKYVVDGELVPDPINPQQVTLDNGKVWSRFFTQLCHQPIVLERWEFALLQRISVEMLPFRTAVAKKFFEEQRKGDPQYEARLTGQLDESVGAANYIDKVLAREENHRLIDYRICLDLIRRVLQRRNPTVAPENAPSGLYQQLFAEMADTKRVPDGWDASRYGNPSFFLYLLRRHTITGAFCHPKYGGNIDAHGWKYLGEMFKDGNGKTLFDWRKVMEWPLGENRDYLGIPGGAGGDDDDDEDEK